MKTIPEPLKVLLGNLTQADLTFIKDCVAIFTDPTQEEILRLLRTGQVLLQMDPATGRLHIANVVDSSQSVPLEIIAFVARFTALEWETIQGDCEGRKIIELARKDVPRAELRARDILGYLPTPPRTLEPANG